MAHAPSAGLCGAFLASQFLRQCSFCARIVGLHHRHRTFYPGAVSYLPVNDPLRGDFADEFKRIPEGHKLHALKTMHLAPKPRATSARFWKAAARKSDESLRLPTSRKHPSVRSGVKGKPPILKYLKNFDIVRQVNNDGLLHVLALALTIASVPFCTCL